jgi:dTDP-glucose 4,6-dehydratase
LKKFVLLGGGGVFGVHTAKYLLENANPGQVICVGRNLPRSSAYTIDVGRNDLRYRYEQIHIVFEQDRLFELLDREQPEVIINFAALAHSSSWANSWRYYETNVTTLARICEQLMQRNYLERFLQVGTSELYGHTEFPATEDAPLRPTSPYAISKMAGDLHLMSLWNVYRFPMNIIRPSNAFGPGQQLHRVVPRAVLCGLIGERLPLEGGGRTRRSFIHATDLASAIYLICERAPFGRVYNAGPKEPISIYDLVSLVAKQVRMTMDELCEMVERRKGEDAQYWLDSTLINKELGWEPRISLEEGVADMIAWGQKYLDLIREESRTFTLHA